MANKHKKLNTYPDCCKMTFTVSDEDYPFYYEAMKVMPEHLEYHLMEGEPETLVIRVWLSDEPFKFEEKYLKKVEELKRKYDHSYQ